jgi:hypothetical protein
MAATFCIRAEGGTQFGPSDPLGRITGLEGHCGAIAFSRTGDPALGDFEDAVILKTVGEVDVGLLSV